MVSLKNILILLGFVFLGVLGAAVFELLILPCLLTNPELNKFALLQGLQREIITYPVRQIIVQEGDGLKQAIEQVESAVAVVGSKEKEQDCSFVLTSDGVLVVKAGLAQAKDKFLFFNGEKTKFLTLFQSKELGLALVKIAGKNLKTTSFADLEKTGAGEKVFLFRKEFVSISTSTQSLFSNIINEGIIKNFSLQPEKLWETNIVESKAMQFCPVFNFKGEFLGLANVAQNGNVAIIPNFQIRALNNF